MADFALLLEKAQTYVDLANGATDVVKAAASEVLTAFQALSASEGEDITQLLTGNPIADRARIETAAAAGVVNSTIDWANLPAEAFRIAKVGLDLGMIALAFLPL